MILLDVPEAENNWPNFPVLPLVNRKRISAEEPLGEMGLYFHPWCHAQPKPAHKVYHVNLVLFGLADVEGRRKLIDEAKVETFDTIDDLLAAGWKVD